MKYLFSLSATAAGTTLFLALLFPQSNYDANVSPVQDLLWVFALLGMALLVALLYPRRTYRYVPPVHRTRRGGETQGIMNLYTREMAYAADRFATAPDTRAIVHVRSTVYVLERQGVVKLEEEGILAVINDLECNTGRRHQASSPILMVVK